MPEKKSAKVSAGLLMYRRRGGEIEVLLVHPGGPFFQNKDLGAWTVPKGLIDEGESALETAQREFLEETGLEARGPFLSLGSVIQKGGKTVHAWAFEGDADPAAITSNTFTVEWPLKSGRMATFPEVDRAEFFSIAAAKQKINPAQIPLIDSLAVHLANDAN